MTGIIRTFTAIVSLAAVLPAAQALDIAPATPSARIDQTLPTPQPSKPAPDGLFGRTSVAGPAGANAGAVYVIPLGRQPGEVNDVVAPYSRRDSDNEGVPNFRDSRPSDADRQ